VAGTTYSTDFALTGTPLQKQPTADFTLYATRLSYPASGGGTGGGTGGSGPTITAVQNGASYLDGFPVNSWMQIKGTNLSTVAFDTWANSISNGVLPTTLDTVTVTVGGQPAYVYFVSPTQINVVAPNIAAGSTTVVVKNSLGTSAAFTSTGSTIQPAFFPWPGGYIVASHSADFSYAVKNGTFPGTTTIPAKPGEVIILWGAGFGPTNPVATTGVQAPASPLEYSATPVTVNIGSQAAQVVYAILAPGYAALYQIAITVPLGLANGDYPIVATVNGVSSPTSAMITIQQ
jgi:uncharacterized protein (TIGR03437 family)